MSHKDPQNRDLGQATITRGLGRDRHSSVPHSLQGGCATSAPKPYPMPTPLGPHGELSRMSLWGWRPCQCTAPAL